jgi:integrase
MELAPAQQQVPWNKNKLVGPKPPLKLQEVWAIRIRLQLALRTRELALFNLALDSKLRGCDLVSLRVSDLMLGTGIANRATVFQRKTQRPVQFEITDQTKSAVLAWISKKHLQQSDYLFPSHMKNGSHLSTRQYRRILGKWVRSIGLDPAGYGTHTMRRTKPTLIYRRTKNLRAIQLLLGHTKLESTVRYLGIEVDDALELAEQTES